MCSCHSKLLLLPVFFQNKLGRKKNSQDSRHTKNKFTPNYNIKSWNEHIMKSQSATAKN